MTTYDYYVKLASDINPEYLQGFTPAELRLWMERDGQDVYKECVDAFGCDGVVIVAMVSISTYAGSKCMARITGGVNA